MGKLDVSVLMIIVDWHMRFSSNIIKHIHEYYPDFKIMCLDNTVNVKFNPPEYCTVYKNTSDNKTTAYSRKVLVEHCTSDYVWFVDDDDDVVKVDLSELKNDVDIHNFGYLCHGDFSEKLEQCHSELPLWTQIIRTSLLKEIQQYITEDVRAVCSEDAFLTRCCRLLTDKVKTYELFPYIFNRDSSNSMQLEYSGKNFKKFETVISGRNQLEAIGKAHFPDLETDYDASYFVYKMFCTTGLYWKELLLEILLKNGVDNWEVYRYTYIEMNAYLSFRNRSESAYIVNLLMPEADEQIPMPSIHHVIEKEVELDGRLVTIIADEYDEVYNFEEFE